MALKYSSFQGVVAWSGGEQLLRNGQSIDADHPLAKERPDLFEGEAPEGAQITNQPPLGTVESTMQPPGGNRATRVPRQASGS